MLNQRSKKLELLTKNMKKILIGLLLFGILMFGCIEPEEKETPVLTNQNKVVNNSPLPKEQVVYTYYSSPAFMIYYPKGWVSDNDRKGAFIFTSTPDSAGDVFGEEILVEILESNMSSPGEFMNYENRFLTDGDKLLKNQTTKFKEKDAYEIEFEGKLLDGKTEIYYKTIYFRNGWAVYRINYAIQKSMKPKYDPIFAEILERFKIGTHTNN